MIIPTQLGLLNSNKRHVEVLDKQKKKVHDSVRDFAPLCLAIDAHGPPFSCAWMLVHRDKEKVGQLKSTGVAEQ